MSERIRVLPPGDSLRETFLLGLRDRRGHLPRARARSSGRELAPLPGAARSMNPAPRGRAAPRRVSRQLLRPLPGPPAPQGVPGNQSPSQQETKLLLKLAPWPRGRQTPRAGSRLRECRWEEGASYLSQEFLHTPHQQGAGLRGGSFHVVPTQITLHAHPHSRTHSGCPQASSPTPPAGSHLTLPLPPHWGVNKVGREQRECTCRGDACPGAAACAKLLEPTEEQAETQGVLWNPNFPPFSQ